jgi:hypothetical protein
MIYLLLQWQVLALETILQTIPSTHWGMRADGGMATRTIRSIFTSSARKKRDAERQLPPASNRS